MIIIPHPFSGPETLPISAFWAIFAYLTIILLALITSYKDRVKFFEKGAPALQITASTTISLLLLYIFPISSFVILAFDGFLAIYYPIYILSILFFVVVLAILLIAITHNMEREHELRWLHNTKQLQKEYQLIVKKERSTSKLLAKQLSMLSITEQHKLNYDGILPATLQKELVHRMSRVRTIQMQNTLPQIAHGIGHLIISIPARQAALLNTAEGRGLLRIVSDKSQELKREVSARLTKKEKAVEAAIFRIIITAQKANLTEYEQAQVSATTSAIRRQEEKVTRDIIEVLDDISTSCLEMSQNPSIAREDIDKLLQKVKINMMDIRTQIQELGESVADLEKKRYTLNKKRGNILFRVYDDIIHLIHTP